MAEISVVIPVYKVERYLRRCVDSVLSQTFRDIQVILVDDGSPDRSGQICEEYAAKDERVRVIHKENGGLSDARNAGIDVAEGAYILFIDSDDYVERDMLDYLYHGLVRSGADLATCGVYDVYGDHTNVQEREPDEAVPAEQAFSYILQGTRIRGAIWNKLMRRDLIRGLYFPVGKTYEDVFFTCELMRRVKTVWVGTAPKYYYIHRENSISTRPYSPRDFDIVEGYARTFRIVKRDFPGLRKAAEFRVFWSWFYVFDKILAEKDFRKRKEYRELKRRLRRNMGPIVRNPYFQKSRRLAAVILWFHVGLYRKVMFWNQRRNLRLSRENE